MSEPAVLERRRAGRALLAASAVGMTLTAAACGPTGPTNPAPCNCDAGLNAACDGSVQPDAGVDAPSILVP